MQEEFAIRLTELTGQVQTVATNVGWITPPAWSPLGDRLAYLVATDRYLVEDDIPHPGAVATTPTAAIFC